MKAKIIIKVTGKHTTPWIPSQKNIKKKIQHTTPWITSKKKKKKIEKKIQILKNTQKTKYLATQIHPNTFCTGVF